MQIDSRWTEKGSGFIKNVQSLQERSAYGAELLLHPNSIEINGN